MDEIQNFQQPKVWNMDLMYSNISKNESLDKFCLKQSRFAQNKLRELQGLPADVWAFLSENQFNLNISSYILKF